jgi:hypothetical protein
MDVFAGVAEHMPQENSVDDISHGESLSRYSHFFYASCDKATTPIDISPPFLSLSPSARHVPVFLELIFSCVEPSQELFTPHLAPNTQSAPPTAELRNILGMAAQEMLIVFLKKSRTRRSVARGMGAGSTGHPVDVVSLYSFF